MLDINQNFLSRFLKSLSYYVSLNVPLLGTLYETILPIL